MKILQLDLLKVLKLFDGVIARKNTIPLLGCVVFSGNKIKATNLDFDIEASLPSIGRSDADFLTGHSALLKLVSGVPSKEEIIIEKSPLHEVCVGFGNSKYRMATLKSAEYPPSINEGKTGSKENIGSLGVVNAFRRVSWCATKEETRYYLQGVSFANIKNKIHAVATDGHRLALHPVDHAPCDGLGVIFPLPLVYWLSKQSVEPQEMTLYGKAGCRLEYPGVIVNAKLIEGDYPDVSRVVPSSPVLASIEKVALIRSLCRALSVMDIYNSKVAAFEFTTNGLNISGGGENKFTENIDCKLHGTPLKVGFNVKYILDVLRNLKGDEISVAATSPSDPTVWSSPDDLLSVILMPGRI